MSATRSAAGVRLVGVIAAAVALAGCGGGSSARRASTSSAGRATASDAARTYRGPGFEFAIPAGWMLAARNTGPAGVSAASFQAPNHRATIAVHVYTHPSETVPQAIADDVASDTVEAQAYSSYRVLKRSLHTGSVTGARQSAELVETYVDPGGTARYDDLVVLMPSGSLVDVEVVASSRYASYDPAATTGSFRLVANG